MNHLDAYMKEVASRKYKNDKGEYNITVLLAMCMCHIPRTQEMVRVLAVALEKIMNHEADDIDDEENGNVVSIAAGALSSVAEIAADGLSLMGYELEISEGGNGSAIN